MCSRAFFFFVLFFFSLSLCFTWVAARISHFLTAASWFSSYEIRPLFFNSPSDSLFVYPRQCRPGFDSCQFIFMWMAYITDKLLSFSCHFHVQAPILPYYSAGKCDIWHQLTYGGWTNVKTYDCTNGHVTNKVSHIHRLPIFSYHWCSAKNIVMVSEKLYYGNTLR